jgi:PadR family transcriptional regulator AphA
MPITAELDLADWATLALIGEGDAHGWSVVRAMHPEGEVGRVWACSRARVYRALDVLVAAGLVQAAGVEAGGGGPARRLMTVTPAGRRALAAWLDEPVEHVRELRSELLLKLLLDDRAGRDPAPLLAAQRALLQPIEAGLAHRLDEARGFERTLVQWRLESCRAALRFVDGLVADIAVRGGPS